jgi:large subunit ribosomal protein L30
MVKKIKVSLVKSVIGTRKDHKQTVVGLGLRRINDSSILEDTPCVRGMVSKVSYLLRVEELS